MGRSYRKGPLLAVIAAWAGGCATPAGPGAPPTAAPPAVVRQVQPTPQPAADSRFVLAPELKPILEVSSVHLTTPPSRFLKIQVNVQNKTEMTQRFRYRIEWFDKDGLPLRLAGPNFETWMLLPGETSLIAVTAPATSAADFGIVFVR